MLENKLKDTVDLMLSEEEKDNIKAEYYQLFIRMNDISYKRDNNNDMPIELYNKLLESMQAYGIYLRVYAIKKGVDLEGENK